jgi:hypothetical protein
MAEAPRAVSPPPAGPPAPAALAATAAPAPHAPVGRDGHPLTGYHDGRFFLRDASDNFRLFPTGMMLLDASAWLGSGVGGRAELVPRLAVRAARLGVSGQILEPLAFSLMLAADGQAGTHQRSAAPPGIAPTETSAQFADAQTADNRASILDAWLNFSQSRALNVMVGQYRIPFSFDNATPLRALPLHERALAVRALGAPEVRDIGATIWGDVDSASVFYAVGLFQGDGRNRPAVDRRWDVIGRATIRPLSQVSDELAKLQVGVSARGGWRDGDRVQYDYPALRSQQGFELWRPVYIDSLGRRIHVIPNDAQLALAGELALPLDRFDFVAELVWVDHGTREAVEGFAATNTERTGSLTGTAAYLHGGYWLWGEPRLLQRGQGVRPPTLDWDQSDPPLPHQALELVLRGEVVDAEYAGAARRGSPNRQGLDGDLRVFALGLGLNYWATRHARLSLGWTSYFVPSAGSGKNRALAPGASSEIFHELGGRLGAMF